MSIFESNYVPNYWLNFYGIPKSNGPMHYGDGSLFKSVWMEWYSTKMGCDGLLRPVFSLTQRWDDCWVLINLVRSLPTKETHIKSLIKRTIFLIGTMNYPIIRDLSDSPIYRWDISKISIRKKTFLSFSCVYYGNPIPRNPVQNRKRVPFIEMKYIPVIKSGSDAPTNYRMYKWIVPENFSDKYPSLGLKGNSNRHKTFLRYTFGKLWKEYPIPFLFEILLWVCSPFYW